RRPTPTPSLFPYTTLFRSDFLATAHEDQKFGLPLETAADAVALIRAEDSLEFLGLHCHIGSQIFGSDGFAESAARLLTVHRDLRSEEHTSELQSRENLVCR